MRSINIVALRKRQARESWVVGNANEDGISVRTGLLTEENDRGRLQWVRVEGGEFAHLLVCGVLTRILAELIQK